MSDKFTVGEVANYLGISRTTVWKMITSGELPVTKNPIDKRQHLVPVAAVESLKEQGRVKDTRVPHRPVPRTFGMYDGPVEIHSDELEEYMREHWRPA